MYEYQVMPDLLPDEYQELKADIAARGVQVAIEFDELGNVLDGHHRLRACEELGITIYPKVVREGMTEEEKRTHARKLNMARRHLSQAQRRELIYKQLQDTPEVSDRQIAAGLGVHHTTVSKQRKSMESTGEISQLPTRVGADGKERAAPLKVEDTETKQGRKPNNAKPLLAERIKALPDDPIVLDPAIVEYMEKYWARSYHFQSMDSRSHLVNTAIFSYLWDEGIMQGITGDKEGYIWRQFFLASRQLSHILDEGSEYLDVHDMARMNRLMKEFYDLWDEFNERRDDDE